MSLSTRLPVAIHILTFLAARQDRLVSSESIAKSVAANPAAIRKTMGMLTQAGLVVSQAGVHGGFRLAKAPDKILLSTIYRAVEDASLFQMHTPEPRCPLAQGVSPEIERSFKRVTHDFENSLAKQTLLDVAAKGIRKFHQKFGK